MTNQLVRRMLPKQYFSTGYAREGMLFPSIREGMELYEVQTETSFREDA
jgi:hypothetical protein